MADVVISVIVRATTAKGIALYRGATREYVDETTGEIVDKEHWHWMPVKFVKRLDGEVRRGKPERVQLPDWLAKKEGLI
jgi:hypothetical protein